MTHFDICDKGASNQTCCYGADSSIESAAGKPALSNLNDRFRETGHCLCYHKIIDREQ